MSETLLIRCDGAPEIGFGHVVRCLALADELRSRHGFEVDFAMIQGSLGFAQVQQRGYRVLYPQPPSNELFDEGAWLQNIMSESAYSALILDVRTDLAIDAIRQIRRQGALIVTIDDPSERRLAADLAFYPPVPQVERMDWTGFTGERYVGWDWVLLRPEFAQAGEKKVLEFPRTESTPLRILLTMGGSDPADLTQRVIKLIDGLGGDFETHVVLGEGYIWQIEMFKFLNTACRKYILYRNVPDMSAVMRLADFAVASYGMTAFELAALKIPAIYMCLTEDHAESAFIFTEAGVAVSLGLFSKVSDTDMIKYFNEIMRNRSQILFMREKCNDLIDGNGVYRISEVINKAIMTYKR